jgi:hypothetical protein
MGALNAAMASKMARIALGHVTREYPHKLDHVLLGDEDARTPRDLHPIFFGSFDWHSCVHGWWSLLTLRRLFPEMPEATDIERLADDTFTSGKVAAERVYLDRPLSNGFERPYGWAWLLQLHLEATQHSDRRWGAELEPLARAFAERFKLYLPTLTYPIRAGTHGNTAFALVLALEWAEAFDPELKQLICSRTRDWFGGDRSAGDEAGASGALPDLVRAVPSPRFRAPAGDPVHPGHRQRPKRRQNRPPRRLEPQPRLVLAGAGLSAIRRGASRRGAAAPVRRLYGRALAAELRAAGAPSP